jgi:tetratricopeptide (TPR) repeat protein
MNPDLLILVLGFFYAVVFGLISILEREGISAQLMIEVFAITALTAGGGYLTGSRANSILFLIFLYLLTMRSRLLADIANLLSRRDRHLDAISMLQVALRMLPDKATRLIVYLQMGIAHLRHQDPESAQALFESVFKKAESGGLGIRNRTACHYYLGLSYQQQRKTTLAKQHFRYAIESLPTSPYGKAAALALEEYRQTKQATSKKSKSTGAK